MNGWDNRFYITLAPHLLIHSDMKVIQILRRTLSEFSTDQGTQLAAALAYYTLFSLAPFMVIVITLTAFSMRTLNLIEPDTAVDQQVLTQLAGYVGPNAAEQIGQLIKNAVSPNKSIMHALLSIGALLFGATAIMGQLQWSLNEIWGVKANARQSGVWSFITRRLLSFALILTVAFILLVSLILSTMVHAFNDYANNYLGELFSGWIPILTESLLQLIVTTMLFGAIFRFLPDAVVAWRDVLLGAFVTSILFNIGRHGIGIYLANSEIESGFGAAGGLVALILWIYYSSVILLMGAEFTQVWADAHGRKLVPIRGATLTAAASQSKDSRGAETSAPGLD